MNGIDVLRNDPILQHACKLYSLIHEVIKDEATVLAVRLNDLMWRVPRLIADGVMAESAQKRSESFSEALELARQADEALHEIAMEAYCVSGIPQSDPIYDRLIKTFLLADQLREMLFHALQDQEVSKFTA